MAIGATMERKENMTNENEIDMIFNEDEMRLLSVKPEWSEEDMLNQQGIFFLKDVALKLEIHSSEFKKEARVLEKMGKDPWRKPVRILGTSWAFARHGLTGR